MAAQVPDASRSGYRAWVSITAARLAANPVRGEITLVLWPGDATGQAAAASQHLDEVIATLLDAGLSAGQAADVAAKIGAGPRNSAYRAALAEAKRRNT